jgi:hypothetical protein
MKKLLTVFFIFLSLILNAQETPPSGMNFKTLPTCSFKYYTPTKAVWMYKGATYGWTNLAKVIDSLQYFRRLNNHDSLNTLQEKSYNSLNDLPDLSLKANVDDPTFTTKITTPGLNIPASATINYFWKCVNGTTGEGAWTAVSETQFNKGGWNANSNTPTLANGTGTNGWYYTCTVSGTTNFGAGNITFAVGDQVMYDGSIWFRIPVSISVNLTGPITSVGNATSIASQTGTGSTFAMSASPSFTTVASITHATNPYLRLIKTGATARNFDLQIINDDFYITDATGNSNPFFIEGGTGNVMIGQTSGSAKLCVTGNINATGTMTASNFILSSDKRLKENISCIKNLHKFDDIKFVQFNLKSEPNVLRFGVIAQEVESIAPELVRMDSEGMKSVAYIDLLIVKIQQLEQRVTELEKANDRQVKRDWAFYKKLKHEK